MASTDFPLAPFSSSLLYYIGLLPVAVAGLLAYEGYAQQMPSLYAAAALPVVVAVLLFWMATAIHHCSITVSDDKVSPHGMGYGRDIDKKSLKLDQAKVVDTETGEYRPANRRNGVGLPELKLGWFKLGNGEKALVFLSDRKHAVYIPTTEGYSLLLSPQDTEGFLSALRR